ncbi:MAG TPA: acetyl-CoA synthetase [Micromonosporaceae bacterium]|nr:acetyl-CoA synthetase [Micromonosporaceae bacterium]
MTTAQQIALSALWSASSVAIIGASERPNAPGRLPIEFLRRYGYRGAVYPVRPDGAGVLGAPSYRSVRECPGQVDLAMVMVPAAQVPSAIDDCAAAGVRVAVICSSGFAETGAAGAKLQSGLIAKARAAGMRVVGPNCIGSVTVATGLVASFSPLFSSAGTRLIAGATALVSQSGALGYGVASLAFERGLGLGWIVNTGNEADVSALEAMAALAAEPACTSILGYVESLSDVDALRRLCAAGKPVALLKAGRSEAGQRAAASHTGALAAGERVTRAALRQFGIVQVDDLDELLDVGDALAQHRRPAGSRVAVLTTSGGAGILAADAIDKHGLSLAELSARTAAALDEMIPAYGATANPVDVTATVINQPDLFDRTLDALIDDDGVDMVIACFVVLTGEHVDQVVGSLVRAAQRSGKPILVSRAGADQLAPNASQTLRAAGVPAYPTPARAVRAAAALWQTSRRRPVRTSGPSRSDGRPGAEPADEHALKQRLSAAGIPVPRGRIASSAADAVRAVCELGGLAVFKAVVPGLLHKTEAGGVVVGVDADDAPAVFGRLAALGGDVLVEEMVEPAVEVLAGIAPSPLGQVLTLGPGGVLAEVVDDVALRLLPVGAHDVREMIAETRLHKLLAGTRGRPAADAEALVEAVVRITDLVAGWPPGFELDLNPIAVLPAGLGVRVLDAAYVAPSHQES